MPLSPFVLLFALLTTPEAPLPAPALAPEANPWCEEQTHYVKAGEETYCEVRTLTRASGGPLRVEAAPHGSISARGENRRDVQVQARIWARSQTAAGAGDLVDRVIIRTDGTLRVEIEPGAVPRDRKGRPDFVSVSFRLRVPLASDLDLKTNNGGLHITDVTGRIRFQSMNGGVHLQRVGGDVEGQTMNGGLDIDLDGDQWDGAHLDVSTRNGGVDLSVPRSYSAVLETGTRNGHVSIGHPAIDADTRQRLTDRRHMTNDRSLSVTLGDGGPMVRVRTTNGAVSLTER